MNIFLKALTFTLLVGNLYAMEQERPSKKQKTEEQQKVKELVLENKTQEQESSLQGLVFEKIPKEIILNIIELLEPEEIKDLAGTCKYFRAIINDPSFTESFIKLWAEKIAAARAEGRKESYLETWLTKEQSKLLTPEFIAAGFLGTMQAIEYLKEFCMKRETYKLDNEEHERIFTCYDNSKLTDALILTLRYHSKDEKVRKKILNLLRALKQAGASVSYELSNIGWDDDFSRLKLFDDALIQPGDFPLGIAIKRLAKPTFNFLLGMDGVIKRGQDLNQLRNFANKQEPADRLDMLDLIQILDRHAWEKYRIDFGPKRQQQVQGGSGPEAIANFLARRLGL